MKGAYQLGKALIEQFEKKGTDFDTRPSESGGQAVMAMTDANTIRVKEILMEAAREAGFMSLFMVVMATMRVHPPAAEEEA